MLKNTLTEDMKAAMRAGEKDKLTVIRMAMAAVKQVEVDKRIELEDDAVLAIIEKMVKQRRESISQFEKGGRPELAAAEAAEIDILKKYLPEPLDETALNQIIEDAIASTGAESMRDMGKVMAAVKAAAAGRADMGKVSGVIKARLG